MGAWVGRVSYGCACKLDHDVELALVKGWTWKFEVMGRAERTG